MCLNGIIYSDTAEDYNNKGHNLFMKGLYDEAIVEYKKAIELDPTFAVYNKNLALVYFCKGDFNNTIEECRKAVELSKSIQPFDWAFIHGILAQSYFYKGEYKLAVFHYVNALEYKVNFTNKFVKKISPYIAKYPARSAISTPAEIEKE